MKRTLQILAALAMAAILAPAFAAPVAVVAREKGYCTSLAGHVQRWLKGQSVESSLVGPQGMPAALASAKIAFLVGFDTPSAAEIRQLSEFRSRGGKLVVFYSSSPALASLMGVKPLGYAKSPYPGAWSRMDFDSGSLAGCPRRILQTSSVLMRAAPVKGRSSVMATWCDRSGKSTGDAAWLRSDAGFWMTHVLLADGDETYKAQLLAAMCGSVDLSLWSASRAAAREKARSAELRSFARAQKPRRGELHAVWDHSGCGLYPGRWSATMDVLAEARVTDLFINVAGAGFAHYASSVLPHSRTYRQEGDQLRQCVDAAKGRGIRVHAWLLCFTGAWSSPDVLDDFRRRGWRLAGAGGKPTEYLDPSNAALRSRLLDAIDEMQARYRIDGIHLDYVRWYEGASRPANAADVITGFVADARRRVKRPRWLTAAVFGKYPGCIRSVGQDWCGWLDAGLVDYAVPMDYTESPAMFEELVRQHAQSASRARKIIAGIGVTANESRLDARKVIEQINISRRYGLAGNALFDLDVTLQKQILPYLRMGVW